MMKKLFVLCTSIVFVAAFAASSIAAEWNFYGQARMATFWQSRSNEVAPPTGDEDLLWDLQGNARIGAKVKANDAVSGQFEYGTGVNTRILKGMWNFGGGTLTVGQDYTPIDLFYSASVAPLGGGDDNMLYAGQAYEGRLPLIQVQIADLKFAMVKPNVSSVIKDSDSDCLMPKLEVAYSLNASPVFVEPFAGYQYFTNDVGSESYDVHAYLVGLGLRANVDAASIKTAAFYGQNTGNFGIYQFDSAKKSAWSYAPNGAVAGKTDSGDNKIIDNDTFGCLLTVGFKASDMLALEAGVSYQYSKLDVSGSKKDDLMAYYLQSTITLAPGVMIIPEIGVVDFRDNAAEVDEGRTFYAGAKWQINF